MDPCWYVTASWGIHDERWTAALRDQGFTPSIISLERDGCTAQEARTQLEQAAVKADMSPVLAGPLTSVTTHLAGIRQRLIGLSWGFDLMDGQATPGNLDQLDHLIVDSPASVEVAQAAGVPLSRISQIYWGTDLDTFTPEGPQASLAHFGVPEGAQVVLSLRAHEPLYRVRDLIDAWSDVVASTPNTHLLIGNSGSLTAALIDHVHDRGLTDSIHFIGRIEEDQLPSLLRSADLYVSTSPVDGTSVTLLQAMASGCPVLVTDAPGNRHWVSQGVSGYLYPPSDVRELARAILTALQDTTDDDIARTTTEALRIVRQRADWSRNQRQLRSALDS